MRLGLTFLEIDVAAMQYVNSFTTPKILMDLDAITSFGMFAAEMEAAVLDFTPGHEQPDVQAQEGQPHQMDADPVGDTTMAHGLDVHIMDATAGDEGQLLDQLVNTLGEAKGNTDMGDCVAQIPNSESGQPQWLHPQQQRPEEQQEQKQQQMEMAAVLAAAVAAAVASEDRPIASEAELEGFGRLPMDERHLTGPLRGVLAETAVTGLVRYKWSLLQPLVEFAMEQVRCIKPAAHPIPAQTVPSATHQSDSAIHSEMQEVLFTSSMSHAPCVMQHHAGI